MWRGFLSTIPTTEGEEAILWPYATNALKGLISSDKRTGNYLICLDEVDDLANVEIGGTTGWTCLLLAIRNLQLYFAQHNVVMLVCCALTPSSMSIIDSRRTITISTMVDLPDRRITPITAFEPPSLPQCFTNQYSTFLFPAIPLDTLLQGRPIWLVYARQVCRRSDFDKVALHLLEDKVKDYVKTSCPVSVDIESDVSRWITGALTHIIVGSSTHNETANIDKNFANISLVECVDDSDVFVIYRPSDLPLSNSLWDLIYTYIGTEMPESEKMTKLCSLLLDNKLQNPPDPTTLGLAVEHVIVLLLLYNIHSLLKASQQHRLDVVRASSLLELLGPCYGNHEGEVRKEGPKVLESYQNWFVGGVQTFHLVEKITKNSRTDDILLLLYLAFVHRCIIVCASNQEGIDLIIPMVHESLIGDLNNPDISRESILDVKYISFISVQVKAWARAEINSAEIFSKIYEEFPTDLHRISKNDTEIQDRVTSVFVNIGTPCKQPTWLHQDHDAFIWSLEQPLVNHLTASKTKRTLPLRSLATRVHSHSLELSGVKSTVRVRNKSSHSDAESVSSSSE
ncbi:hypothetical protein RCL1_004662 [Eukaryota sp. TZLM3-RCL]